MTVAALAEALDENMTVHASWIQRHLPGMEVREDLGFVLVDSGFGTDTFNLICRTRLAEDDTAERAAAGIAWFRAGGRPFSWWVGPADTPRDLGATLVRLGLRPVEGETAMAAGIESILPEPLPDGIQVQRVESPAQLREFAAINAANWDPSDDDVLQFYELAAPLLLERGAPLALHVAYLRGVAVSTVEVTTAAGIAGIYNVSTLAHWRNRGFASALLRHVLAEARDHGIHRAALPAAPDAAGLYRRLGFEAIGTITEYKPAP